MAKQKFEAKVTKEMKRCYARISIPPYPVFRTREIPILIMRRLGTLLDEFTPYEEHMRGGVFYGTSGVAYTLLRCANYKVFDPIRERLLFTAKGYTDASLAFCNAHDLPPVSLLLGKAGVYAVSAVIYKELGFHEEAQECIHLFLSQGAHCLLPDYSFDGGEDLCNGRAGYIAAALWLRKYFRKYFPPKFFYRYLDLIIESCRKYAKQVHSIAPLAYCYYDKQTIGILNGFSGILFIILCFPSYLDKHPKVDEEIKLSVDFILLRQQPNGNFYPIMNSEKTVTGDIVKWRSGGAGILYLMAKAYLRWNHSRYYYSCVLIGDLIWNYGLEFTFTPACKEYGVGLDHGLVGNLYGLLILYRLTKHPIYLQKAHACSLVLKDEKHYKVFVHKENVFSLFNGTAGTIVYLVDLLDSEHAEFPFLPVFSFFNE